MWNVQRKDVQRHLVLLGQRIKALRKARRLTQERLAELAEIHPTFLSEIETGKANATARILFSLAEALGVRPEDLFRFYPPDQAQEFRQRLADLANILREKDPTSREKAFAILDILLT